MKKYIVILVLGFLLAACGMPMAQRLDLVPGEPSAAYDTMMLVLQELGYTIKHTDKNSLIILAEKLTTGEAFSAALSGQARPFQASVSMAIKDGQTSISITITQPGIIMKSGVPKELVNEIMAKFNARLPK